MRAFHRFNNGVKVYDDHLIEAQRIRYAKCNVHEQDEEELFLRIIQDLPTGGVFVSLGSAIGYYALLAKRIRPDLEIHCFEPLDKHRDFLAENILLNGHSEHEFSIHSLAVAPNSEGYLLVDRAYGSFLIKPENAGSRPTCSTDTVCLSGISSIIGSAAADLVQMDIQGLEAAILEEFFSESERPFAIRSFLIGTHGNDIHMRCRNALLKNDYMVLHDEANTANQPDGILAAASG